MTDTTKPTPGWASCYHATKPPGVDAVPVLAFPSVEARDAAADVLSLGGPGNAVMVARAERDAALERVRELERGQRFALLKSTLNTKHGKKHPRAGKRVETFCGLVADGSAEGVLVFHIATKWCEEDPSRARALLPKETDDAE